ncbi:MAG: cobalt ECF transporter T component CbiQ [Anaerolineaceae bacterium]|nr:cobalt ECF transporter T component CbiQ [Anaerolineaceae bacterium]MDD4577601.1 cobalt ECF transporter T component CbiQ [Anaerolineaceae bacterium]
MQEVYAHNRSIIHQMDARVKVIFTLAFVIFLGLTPFGAWHAYILFLTLILSIGLLSRLGLGFILKRALIALPFVLAAFPLVFIGPSPHITLNVFQGIQVFYSPEGVVRFISIALKSWISVFASILLAATTRFPDLLISFQQMRVPKLFIAVIGLMWRYLFVISEEVSRMLRARTSRSATLPDSPHVGGTVFWRARVTGGMAGSLFLRSLERSDRVYAAMLSRGYTGELPASDFQPLSKSERRILGIGLFLVIFLWALGLMTGG